MDHEPSRIWWTIQPVKKVSGSFFLAGVLCRKILAEGFRAIFTTHLPQTSILLLYTWYSKTFKGVLLLMGLTSGLTKKKDFSPYILTWAEIHIYYLWAESGRRRQKQKCINCTRSSLLNMECGPAFNTAQENNRKSTQQQKRHRWTMWRKERVMRLQFFTLSFWNHEH